MTDNNDEFRFVSLLALELNNGDISLPSLPDVVLKIRGMLANDNCDFEKISKAVTMDPVLVSRLFVFANSAFHNRANVKIESLEVAISRLGFEVVRNTAMSVAMRQLYTAEKHSHAAKHLRAVWARGMKLSSMSYAVARRKSELNVETAFLCGLLNEVGKLYIITKADEFPELLGSPESLNAIFDKWTSQISKSIIESWGFPDEMAESADPASYLDQDPEAEPRMVDVLVVAKMLIDNSKEQSLEFSAIPSYVKLGIDNESVSQVLMTYRDKLKTMQQTLV